jgi:hypothetical protein
MREAVRYQYDAFGLHIASEIECPQLRAGEPGNSSPDLVICRGTVPHELEHAQEQGSIYQISGEHLLLNIERVGRYLVSEGRAITVEPDPAGDERDVRLFLLGSAMGALLHQRGVWPLHGSAVASERKAIIFVGASGCGKSTLAGAFHQRGFRVLSDDICAITNGESGIAQVWPAYPRLSLWADAVSKLRSDPGSHQRAHSEQEKYEFPVQHFTSGPMAVAAVYSLYTSDQGGLCLTPLKGFAKAQELTANTYRLPFLTGMRRGQQHFQQALALAQQARVVSVTRPRQPFLLDELADLIERDAFR